MFPAVHIMKQREFNTVYFYKMVKKGKYISHYTVPVYIVGTVNQLTKEVTSVDC